MQFKELHVMFHPEVQSFAGQLSFSQIRLDELKVDIDYYVNFDCLWIGTSLFYIHT